MLELYAYVLALLSGDVTLSNAPVAAYHLVIDHSLTLLLCAIAFFKLKSKSASMSEKIATSLIAVSYLISSIDYYFFNFLSSGNDYDYTVYLSYTFMDSMTVLLMIFGHLFVKERFSFTANAACLMMFASSVAQFFITSLFLYSQAFNISNSAYYFLANIYTVALNVICFVGAYAMAFPIKAQVLFEATKSLLKRNKEIFQ